MLAANRTGGAVYTTPQPLQALGLALLVELILLVGMAIIFVNTRTVTPKTSAPVALTIVDEPTPPAPIAKPVPLPPQPKPKVTPIHQAKRHPSRSTPPVPAPAPPVPVAEAPSPTAFSVPVTPPVPPQPPPPVVTSTVELHAEYADRVRAAVQAAVYYPAAAVAMHFSGRVQVAFQLHDGTPGETRIMTSSGLGIIDRAALQAVQTARYPAPPNDLRGHDLSYQVWVILTLTN